MTATDLLLEDFSTNGSTAVSGSFLGPYGAAVINGPSDVFSIISSPPDRTNNEAANFFDYHIDASNSWGIILTKKFDSIQNVSSYEGQSLEFSFYSERDDDLRSIAIQLRFDTDNDGTTVNAWNIKAPPLLSLGHNNWTTVTVPLSEAAFILADGSGDFDLTKLEGIGVVLLNNSADSDTEEPVYVDDIKLVASISPSLLIVSPLADTNGIVNVNFNNGNTLFAGDTANGAGTYHSRYVSEPVVLSYLAPYGPWSVRIYTTRSDKLEGLIDKSVTDASGLSFAERLAVKKIPLKFTIAPDSGDNAFDIGNDIDWNGGDSAKFSYVIKEGGEDPDNPFYFTLASPANENSPVDTNLEFRFGVDVFGAAANVDYSAEVTIELYIE